MYKNFKLIALIVISMHLDVHAMSPKKNYDATPDSLYLSYEDLYILTTDSVRLHAWLMPPPPALDKQKTIILAGSDAGNMSNYLIHAYKLVSEGYTVLSFDYRGFGSSDTFNFYGSMLYYNEFITDLNSVYQYLRIKKPNDKIGLWGFSMGTIIGTMAYSSSPFDFFVAEGLVTNPFMVSARLKVKKGATLLLPDSADLYKNKLEALSCQMLVFAGNQDDITTSKDAKAFCSLSKKRQLVLYNGNHLEGMSILSKKNLGDIYFKRTFKFLNKL